MELLKLFLQMVASLFAGRQLGVEQERRKAAETEAEALETRQIRQSELSGLDRAERLKRMRETDDRVRAILARSTKRR